MPIQRRQSRDILWTYSVPEIYELLLTERDHNTQDYAEFIASGTLASLLPERSTNRPAKKTGRERS